MAESPPTKRPSRKVPVRFHVSPELRDAIKEAARQDNQDEGPWLRMLTVTFLRKRGFWPRPARPESGE